MYTIGELKERFKGQFKSVEVYRMKNSVFNFHTDNIDYVEDYSDDIECRSVELMDKWQYFRTVEANTSLMPDNIEDEQFPILVIGL